MKGEKEKAKRRKGGEEKKTIVALLVFIVVTWEFMAGKNCWGQKVHLAMYRY